MTQLKGFPEVRRKCSLKKNKQIQAALFYRFFKSWRAKRTVSYSQRETCSYYKKQASFTKVKIP